MHVLFWERGMHSIIHFIICKFNLSRMHLTNTVTVTRLSGPQYRVLTHSMNVRLIPYLQTSPSCVRLRKNGTAKTIREYNEFRHSLLVRSDGSFRQSQRFYRQIGHL